MDRIQTLAVEHPTWSPGQIHREVDGSVSLRTVQRIVAEVRKPEAGGDFQPWRMVDAADPGEIPIVLGLIREVRFKYKGWFRPDRDVAAHYVRIVRAYPEAISTSSGFDVFNLYKLAAAVKLGHAADVEDILMFKPWADGGKSLVWGAMCGIVAQPSLRLVERYLAMVAWFRHALDIAVPISEEARDDTWSRFTALWEEEHRNEATR